MGWDEFWNLSNVKGSKILTLEFMSTLRITKEKNCFRVLNSEFDLPWDVFSTYLGFDIPNIKIEHATKHMNKKEFWYDITGKIMWDGNHILVTYAILPCFSCTNG